MQCLIPTVLVHGNWDTTTARINWNFCASEKLGHFKQQPNEAVSKFLGKQGLPGKSSLAVRQQTPPWPAWEWAEGGVAESCLPWCGGLKLFEPPADIALERKQPCLSKVSEKNVHTSSCSVRLLVVGCFL